MNAIEEVQQYNRQLDSLHRCFEDRLREENRSCVNRINDLQNQLERKANALRETERRLLHLHVPLDARSSEAVHSCIQSIATWRKTCKELEEEWALRSAALEQQHERELERLSSENQALMCRLKCAANNRRFLKDVNDRLAARVDELGGQLSGFNKSAAHLVAENKENQNLLRGAKMEAEQLKRNLEDLETSKQMISAKLSGKQTIDDVLHKQLQLRVEEISALERDVKQEREKGAMLHAVIGEKEAEIKRLHEQLQAQRQAVGRNEKMLLETIREKDALLEVEARERRDVERTVATLQVTLEEERRSRDAAREELHRLQEGSQKEIQAVQSALEASKQRCSELNQMLFVKDQQLAGHDRAIEATVKEHALQLQSQADRFLLAQQLVDAQLSAANDQLREAHEASRRKEIEVTELRDKIQHLLADRAQTGTQLLLEKEQLHGELKSCQTTLNLMESEVRMMRQHRDDRCTRNKTECDMLIYEMKKDKQQQEDKVSQMQATIDDLHERALLTEQRYEGAVAAERLAITKMNSLMEHAADILNCRCSGRWMKNIFMKWQLAVCQKQLQDSRLQVLQARACSRLVRHVSVPRKKLGVYIAWDRMARGLLLQQRYRVHHQTLQKRFGALLLPLSRNFVMGQRLHHLRTLTQGPAGTCAVAVQTQDTTMQNKGLQTSGQCEHCTSEQTVPIHTMQEERLREERLELVKIHHEVIAILDSMKRSEMTHLEMYDKTAKETLDAQRHSTNDVIGELRNVVDQLSHMLRPSQPQFPTPTAPHVHFLDQAQQTSSPPLQVQRTHEMHIDATHAPYTKEQVMEGCLKTLADGALVISSAAQEPMCGRTPAAPVGEPPGQQAKSSRRPCMPTTEFTVTEGPMPRVQPSTQVQPASRSASAQQKRPTGASVTQAQRVHQASNTDITPQMVATTGSHAQAPRQTQHVYTMEASEQHVAPAGHPVTRHSRPMQPILITEPQQQPTGRPCPQTPGHAHGDLVQSPALKMNQKPPGRSPAEVTQGTPSGASIDRRLQLSTEQHTYQFDKFREQVMMRVHLQQLQSNLIPAGSHQHQQHPPATSSSEQETAESKSEASTIAVSRNPPKAIVQQSEHPPLPVPSAISHDPQRITTQQFDHPPPLVPTTAQPNYPVRSPYITPEVGGFLYPAEGRQLFTSTLSHLQSIPHTTRLTLEAHQTPAALAQKAQTAAWQQRQHREQADFKAIMKQLQK